MKNLLSIIIVVLVAVIFLQQSGCGYLNSGKHNTSDTVVLHDTSWKVHDSLIVKTMKGTVIHDTARIPAQYIADTNYAGLKSQYEVLLSKFLALTVYADTLKLDTLGYVAVADTVKENQLKNRSYRYNYKIPTITEKTTITNTIYEKPKTQVFLGGGIDGNQTLGITGASVGLLLKNKKDHIFGLNIGTQVTGGATYGIQSYWKIKLKK